jgi:hypothetical protein
MFLIHDEYNKLLPMIAFIPELKMPETLFRIILGGSGFKQDGYHFLYR